MRRSSALISNLVAKSKTFSRNTPKTIPNPRPFPKCPSRHLQTFSHNTPPCPPGPVPVPSRQRKLRELSELEETFEAATSTDEILAAFEALEPSLAPDDHKLGLACLKVGQHLESISFEDHQKTLEFALRALSILDRDSKPSISVAMALHLVGAVHYTLKRFNDSLGFLNRANRILTAIEKEGSCDFDVRPVVHAVQLQLANTKTAMGRREEALVNLRRCLDLKVAILEPDSRELGAAHRDLAEAYASVLNFKEALPLCLTALEIHEKQLGPNSVDVAHDRRLLGVIYTGLEEHEKALDQNERSQKVLKSWGMGPDLLNAEIDQANIQIALGKFDEAIKTLKGVVEQTDKNSEARALVFVSMAKALCSQEKFADSKRCLEISCEILKNKEFASPEMVAETFVEISSLYESMNEFDTAISLLKRALSMLERLPQEQHLEGNVSAKIGWLLLLTGKVELAIPYLESAAERLKESFGPKHFGVGYIYNNLGAAYLEMNRLQSAAQMFALAKDIMDVSLGPHHADSIEACQSLANAYSAMGSYILALEFQQRVVDAWESYGPNATNELREAKRLLEELKKKACGSISDAILHKALPHESDSLHTKSN